MNQDLYAETTARIVAALQRGAPPWVRPWSQISDAIPLNAQTRRHF
jgi:antirestriction protein ArdC